MKKEVLFLLLDNYADWEYAPLAASLNMGVMPDSSAGYEVRTVAPTKNPVRSLGGFLTLPDYDFESMPDTCAALILIGGTSWQSSVTTRIRGIVSDALNRGIIVGAICNAASFMCAAGFLNHVRHTGNTLQQLEQWGGAAYTNSAGYVEAQAVSDGGIVTANGTGQLEFAREVLLLLEADTAENINASYEFYKHGFVK